MQSTSKTSKIMSMLLVLAMAITYILPMSVFAATPVAEAKASTIERGEGLSRTDIIKVTFDTEVVFDNADWLSNITVKNGTADATFGTGATAVIDSTNQKDITITLGEDHTVKDGATITFANGIVADSTNPADVFNEEITVGGSFEPATINYVIDPSAANVTVEGYTGLPTKLGVGTYTYSASYSNYKDIVSESFEVTEDDLGTTKDVTVKLEKNDADYTALDAAVLAAEAIDTSVYTPDSAEAFDNALTAVKNISRTLKYDEQNVIDTAVSNLNGAISNLASWKEVNFMAVAVADDASVNYAKANKIYLVFAEPIANGADVLPQLSVKSDVASAQWINDTVYELVLKSDSTLVNGDKISYVRSNAIKTKLGAVLKDINDVSIIGNLEPASEKVTATSMAATIVKASSKPGVADGDKIVVVFNAPVKDNPSVINFVTDTGATITGNVVANTDNTVYEIIATGDINENTTLTFGSIANVKLNGSFGNAIVPKAIKAYAVDNDGTELVENDEIVVKFNVPTNGANDISKVSVKGTGYTANLGESTLSWDGTKTQLTIKLASDAVIKDGVEINLKNLGIMDEYETVNAEAASLALKVEGSFGYTVQPMITKAVAFTQNNIDYIRIFFNTEVYVPNEEGYNTGFVIDAGATHRLVDNNNGFTYYEIAMSKDGHGDFESGKYSIQLTGLVDKATKTKPVTNSVQITGGFVTPIIPEILNVVAISNDGSGVAKEGDKIVAIFNTEIAEGDITLLNGKSFGTGYTKSISGNVVEITLGAGTTVEVGSEIRFEGFKDSATLSAVMTTATVTIGGSFGKIIKPEIISATAISNDGSGIPKAGDKIIVVFNTKVEIDGNELYVYEYTLSDNLDNYLVGKTFTITVKSVATGNTETCSKEITGSYGLETMPAVKSVVLSGVGGIETITVVFDRATNQPSFANNEINTLYNNNKHLASADKINELVAAWEGNTVLKITLASTAITSNSDTLNLSGLGIKSLDTGKDVENLENLEIKGSLYPVVTSAAVDDKTITIAFSARTNGDTASAQAAVNNMSVIFGTGATAQWKNNNTELVIVMADDNTMSDAAYIVLNSFNIFDGFSKTYKVVGQYKIDTSKLTKRTLNITSVFVKANNTDNAPREDFTKGIKGDNIIVRFEDATDKVAGTDAKANIEFVATSEDDAGFGTDYTAVWNDNKTIIVTLGEGATVTTASEVKIKDVKFANGTGYLAEGSSNEVVKSLTGQFDGRKYWIINPDKNDTNGRVRVVGVVNKADITNPEVLNPFVVCQSYNNAGVVLSINAMQIADEATNNVVFDFDAKDLAKIKLFVLGGDYTDPEAVVTVYSETIEK